MTEACRRVAMFVGVLVTLTGCDGLFVELGRGQIGTVLVERIFPTGPEPLVGCPVQHLVYGEAGAGGWMRVEPLSEGCLLAVHVDDAVLLNEATMSLWSDALAAYDLSALVALDVILDELRVDGGRDAPLGPAQVHSLAITLDDRVMVDLDDVLAVEAEEEVRIPVPQSLIDAFLASLEHKTAFTSRLGVRLVLRRGVDVPRIVHVRVLIQPVLLVDGWNATF